MTGLVGIVVLRQKAEALVLRPIAEFRISPPPMKPIFVRDANPYTQKSPHIQNIATFGVVKSFSQWHINNERYAPLVDGDRIFTNVMIRERGKPHKGKWKEFNPGLVVNVIGRTIPYIFNLYDYARGVAFEEFINPVWPRGELCSMRYADLILNGSPLKESDKHINGIDAGRNDRNPKRIAGERIGAGLVLMVIGCLVLIPTADAFCESRHGLSAFCGLIFYLLCFGFGNWLVIWNLARLLQEYA